MCAWGSGGATLSVIRYIKEQEDAKRSRQQEESDALQKEAAGTAEENSERSLFAGLRILVIHSGGDSKRVPAYSALGKLFSPVPHRLPDGRSSTLFDEFIIAMSSVPSRIREGMLLLSGMCFFYSTRCRLIFQTGAQLPFPLRSRWKRARIMAFS